MPTKKTAKGKKPTAKKGSKKASKGSGTPTGGGGDSFDDADPPIIVSGGGSIILDRPDKFKDHGTFPNGKKYRIANGVLVSCQINTNTPIPLRPTDKITITWREVTPSKK
jgi:hypothetical protein